PSPRGVFVYLAGACRVLDALRAPALRCRRAEVRTGRRPRDSSDTAAVKAAADVRHWRGRRHTFGASMNAPSLTTVILAAGKGTRMKSERAKVLHEIGGRPLAAFAIDRALELDAARIVVVVGHQADTVQARLSGLFT